jgi:hypothetical protein
MCLGEMSHEVSLQLEFLAAVADVASECENISQSNKREKDIFLLVTLPTA